MRCAYLIVKSLRVNGRTKQYFCGELTIEDAGGASPAASWEFDARGGAELHGKWFALAPWGVGPCGAVFEDIDQTSGEQ